MSYSIQQHYLISKLKELQAELQRIPTAGDFKKLLPNINIVILFGSYDGFLRAAGLLEEVEEFSPKAIVPKILTLDIETSPLIVYSFGIRDQFINPDQIIEDWSVMSWAAKWHDSDEVLYRDVSSQENLKDDKSITREIWVLVDAANIIITQNGTRFDIPKLNGKFEEYGFGPVSPFKHIDTLRIKKKLGLTSNKLEYSTGKFNDKYRKLKHKNFPGMSLWAECLKGNPLAWIEMKEYNCHDVLATEELYFNTLQKWDSTINYGVYSLQTGCCPNCGSKDIEEKDYGYTKTGAFKNFQCNNCRTWCGSKVNDLPGTVRKGLLKNV